MFTYSPYNRGYHTYKDVRRPIVGDEWLIYERKETNAYNRNFVSIGLVGWISKKVVGMFRLIERNWPPDCSSFWDQRETRC